MPLVPFSDLPPSARVWVFAADRPVTGASAERLLGEVDGFLARWMAHGAPLTDAREWRDDRFLAIAVDPRTANASGCSIDGLFRTLRALEPAIGASLVGGGRVYFRDADGAIRSVSRDEFSALAAAGRVTPSTRVFDPTVATLGDWRDRFETEAGQSWHAQLLPAGR
ncbi:MAG: hypothetical protein ACJ79S_16435 [Gemmatimonadaceae bacterium]